MKSSWLLALAFAVAHPAFAAGGERDALVKNFSDAMGMTEIVARSQEHTRASIAVQGETLVANMRKSGMSEASLQKVQASFNAVMEKVVTSWSPDEATRIYTTAIAESMSDDDLRSAIAFYKSPEGKNSQAAVAHAALLMQTYVQNSITKSTQAAMDEFMVNVRSIAEQERKDRRAHSGAPPTKPAD